MKKSELKKGDWIINAKVQESQPWYVCGKQYGFVLIRRGPKIGKLTALADGQIRQFKKYEKV